MRVLLWRNFAATVEVLRDLVSTKSEIGSSTAVNDMHGVLSFALKLPLCRELLMSFGESE